MSVKNQRNKMDDNFYVNIDKNWNCDEPKRNL